MPTAMAAGFEAVQFQLESSATAFDFERRVATGTTVLEGLHHV